MFGVAIKIHKVFSTTGTLVVITVKGVGIQSIDHPGQHFAHYASAHFNSDLTFPNNIYKHTCYYFSSLMQFGHCKNSENSAVLPSSLTVF